ncbi:MULTISPECIES: multidrug/biocide efflux PACE transporter [Pseudomonas]|uniref:Membrane protein n=1 Tax=Pseudomonas putida TaxID=303 RepID=A0AA37REP2_PSEPU|nr:MULTISPECIES: multidrug/biocide efflux PACE transporter [Pseudomonas]PYG72844.1 putative membrane protein [Pseudomonas sp. RV120224-01c]PYG77207.1 putative membrane protein [Pseudomonas sp. RV120224-01b]GLO15177.1 membrane protein [Pseudomonas putida]GLO37312.1 membrane protein [Pseudomonas putida]HDS0964595.1 multidrug/biocide efflux PACE transporter [Pseudomonas putida]
MKNVSFTERLVHAVGYEVFAVLLCAPLLSWVMGKSLATAGALAVTLSVIAMLWNMVYNALVDRWVQTERIHWKASARFVHGLGFEAGLVVWCLPVAAWMLDISLLQAFMVELGFFVIILPYTVLYNWAFDKARHLVMQRRSAALSR